jgi:Protein tyrosine and serine/threonine kinase
MRELEVFQRVGRHRHLMQLRATTTDPEGTFCFLQDYMRHGSLHDALSNMADNGRTLPFAVLMSIAMQVSHLGFFLSGLLAGDHLFLLSWHLL